MFFKNKENIQKNELAKVAALLIHTAKIDENFSEKEEIIIKKTISDLGAKKKGYRKNIK